MKISKEFIVGFTVIAGVVLLFIGINFLKGSPIFGANNYYYAVYPKVQNLQLAAPVTVNGFNVGQVSDLQLHPNNSGNIIVQFTIDEKTLKVPEDSWAKITSDFLGTTTIELNLGSSKALAKPGDTLSAEVGKGLEEVVDERLKPLEAKTKELISSVDSIVDVFKAFFDESAMNNLEQSFVSVRRAIQNFERTSLRLDTLIADEKRRISNIFANVESITTNLEASNEDIKKAIANIESITDTLAQIELSATITNANIAIEKFAGIMTKINNGEGTIGMLVNNDTLAHELIQTNEEVQRLVENIKAHPNRYLHFSIFGRKHKGLKLDKREEEKLDSLLNE